MYRRRKNALALLIICILPAMVLAVPAIRQEWRLVRLTGFYTQKVMGLPVVSGGSFLTAMERVEAAHNPGVYYGGELLPYDENGVLYLPQAVNRGWEGILGVEKDSAYFLCLEKDEYWERKAEAIRENHAFTLWMIGEEDYYEFKLAVTGMPVISIQTERMEEPEPVDPEVDPDKARYGSETLYYGTVTLFNPDVATDYYEIFKSCVCCHEKGYMSAQLDKRGYAIKLQDEDGIKVNKELLGMRKDNSWKLNPLYTDPNRVREKTASQVWEQINAHNEGINETGPRMEYVELVLDGQYRGIYCLVEPVDAKQLELDGDDILYKAVGDYPPEDEQLQLAVDNEWKFIHTLRLRHPKEITDYGEAWQPIRDYLDTFYRGQALEYEEYISHIDLSNMCDLFMFTMACSANDNIYKNIYYAARVDEDGNHVMYQVPWDLDLTFGNEFVWNDGVAIVFNDDVAVVWGEAAALKLLEEYPDALGPYLAGRWQEARDTYLATENVLGLITENRDYLSATGAILREQEKWQNVEPDIASLLQYETERLEWLDGYFAQ